MFDMRGENAVVAPAVRPPPAARAARPAALPPVPEEIPDALRLGVPLLECA